MPKDDFPRPERGAVLFTHGDTTYEYLRDLGKGRNGEQVLVVRPRTPAGLQRTRILKCLTLPDEVEVDERYHRARARLEEEVRLAQYLQHPGIGRVYGLFEMPQALCVMVESPTGCSLNTLLSFAQGVGRYFSEPFILYVGAQVAAALFYAHTKMDEAGAPLGIVNRDINPSRIWLTADGKVWLSDFGVAFSRLNGRVATSLSRVRGEVLYTAPEALFGAAVDARADLFSLGLTLLEFATGRHLYDPGDRLADQVEQGLSKEQREHVATATLTTLPSSDTPLFAEDAILHALTYKPEDVERAASDLPRALRDILHTLLHRNPEDRFATAAEVETLMRGRLAQLGIVYGEQEALREVRATLLAASEKHVEIDLDVEGEEGFAFPREMEEAPWVRGSTPQRQGESRRSTDALQTDAPPGAAPQNTNDIETEPSPEAAPNKTRKLKSA